MWAANANRWMKEFELQFLKNLHVNLLYSSCFKGFNANFLSDFSFSRKQVTMHNCSRLIFGLFRLTHFRLIHNNRNGNWLPSPIKRASELKLHETAIAIKASLKSGRDEHWMDIQTDMYKRASADCEIRQNCRSSKHAKLSEFYSANRSSCCQSGNRCGNH